MRALDPTVPPYGIVTVEQRLGQTVALRRLQTLLLAALAAVALFLSVIGAYGIIHQSVAARTQEIGIRMALGANAAAVLRMVLAGGLAPAVAPDSSSDCSARCSGPDISSFLYETNPLDPLIYAASPSCSSRSRPRPAWPRAPRRAIRSGYCSAQRVRPSGGQSLRICRWACRPLHQRYDGRDFQVRGAGRANDLECGWLAGARTPLARSTRFGRRIGWPPRSAARRAALVPRADAPRACGADLLDPLAAWDLELAVGNAA